MDHNEQQSCRAATGIVFDFDTAIRVIEALAAGFENGCHELRIVNRCESSVVIRHRHYWSETGTKVQGGSGMNAEGGSTYHAVPGIAETARSGELERPAAELVSVVEEGVVALGHRS